LQNVGWVRVAGYGLLDSGCELRAKGHRAYRRIRKWECGKKEFGMRPPASPSCRLFEPEAIGDIGACAPEASRKKAKPMEPGNRLTKKSVF